MWDEGIRTQHQAGFYNFHQGVDRATLNSLRPFRSVSIADETNRPYQQVPLKPFLMFHYIPNQPDEVSFPLAPD